MRILSLLVTLLIVAYLVYAQLGGDDSAAAAQASQREALRKAEAVEAQVQAQFARQTEQISRTESAEQP